MHPSAEVNQIQEELVILLGPPNAGKTSLFNWLTGSQFRTVNYPGATIDCFLGKSLKQYGRVLEILDTPGTYSLNPKGPDEEVTFEALFGQRFSRFNKRLLLVVDATQMEKHLIFAKQLKTLGFPVVVALTMTDLLRKNQLKMDVQKLSKLLDLPVFPIDGRLGGGVQDLAKALGEENLKKVETKFNPAVTDFEWIKKAHQEILAIVAEVRGPEEEIREKVFSNTHRWDKTLMHPFWGIAIFFSVMVLFFSSIFWAAAPLMDLVDQGFSWMAETVESLGQGAVWSDFVSGGLITSFSAVLVFVPQIFILFFGLSLLEDSGYLARAATLIDRPLSKVGLSGRSFVPLLSGFACAVPAIMATRNIRSQKERWLATFIIPLLTCSARLPVYALILGFVFYGSAAWKAGLSLALIYFASLLLSALAAALLNRFVKIEAKNFFMMDLPLYRRPQLKSVFRSASYRTSSYIRRAGPVIFVLAILVWLGTTFPRNDSILAEDQLAQSYAGQAGQVLEPIFKPMGADWRVGVGLISAFAAREVFVSSVAVIFRVTESEEEESLRQGLLAEMRAATWPDGSPLFTLASLAALVVFFMIALQCLSTTAIAYKEMGSLKFALAQLAGLNLAAYVLAVLVYQILSL